MMQSIRLSTMRKADWAAVGLIAALVAGMLYVFIGIGMGRISKLNAEKVRLAQELEDLTKISQSVFDGQAVFKRLEGQHEAFRRLVPETLDVVSFYGLLMGAAHDAEVLIDLMEPGTVTEGDEYRFLSLKIEARSSFESLYDFLFRITHLPRLTKVERLQLSATDDPSVCRLELLLNVYASLPEKKP